jgi:putative intracellular protease/amidase
MGARVWIPLPDRDFDPTEAAVPWWVLTRAGHEVVFATERGARPAADPRLLEGVVFGQLGASARAKALYGRMIESPEARAPRPWSEIDPSAFDGLLLPGGHAPGMRQLLDAESLRVPVAAFWALGRPVAAICHGVLVLARTRDAATGKSLIADRRTTCLPKSLELLAWALTAWKLGRYYRTYARTVEDEVRAALDEPRRQFRAGPPILWPPDAPWVERSAFVVEDGRYLSARWPGDATLFAQRFRAALEQRAVVTSPSSHSARTGV